jgi:DNA (cytosine-5)-methyltransferase 1
MHPSFKFYEFFCGGGMARAGLGPNWQCVFANDIDAKKGESYQVNWGGNALKLSDVALVETKDLPAQADLVWASFPCQDLSLAGMGAGLKGDRSGTFWPFWKKITALKQENRNPKVVVLENVCGALTSHGGKDFTAICKALKKEGYKFGAVVMDAVDFVPQSRPRLFIIGVQNDLMPPFHLSKPTPDDKWHTEALVKAYSKLDNATKASWIWWILPYPPKRSVNLTDIIENKPSTVKWHTTEQTYRLIELMSPVNFAKLQKARKEKKLKVGTIYRRTRTDSDGIKNQRAEIRFDEIAGCLRTPAGGSSRQIIMLVNGQSIRSRLLSSREAARLMGLPDSYKLPKNYNDSYHLLGDGVAVPVVSHIATHLLEPILSNIEKAKKAA